MTNENDKPKKPEPPSFLGDATDEVRRRKTEAMAVLTKAEARVRDAPDKTAAYRLAVKDPLVQSAMFDFTAGVMKQANEIAETVREADAPLRAFLARLHAVEAPILRTASALFDTWQIQNAKTVESTVLNEFRKTWSWLEEEKRRTDDAEDVARAAWVLERLIDLQGRLGFELKATEAHDLRARMHLALKKLDGRWPDAAKVDRIAKRNELVRQETERLWATIEKELRGLYDATRGLPNVPTEDPGPWLQEVPHTVATVADSTLYNQIPWPKLAAHFHRLTLAVMWPGLERAFLRDHEAAFKARQRELARARSLYRFPVAAIGLNKALGGKSHGMARGLTARAITDDANKNVRLVVEAPKGAQLELGSLPLARSKPSDFENGQLRPEAVLRLIRETSGPQVSRMLHVGFALAAIDADTEGRQPDGCFWYTPTRVADLLGYKREDNGKASKSRIPKRATAAVRKDFEKCSNVILRQTMELPDGTVHRIEGTLFYPTKKTHSARRVGQRGRDARSEWRIRDELWSLIKTHYVLIPVQLLGAGDERPDVWAKCLRVYEVLAGHARNNAPVAGKGELLKVSDEWLAAECNLGLSGTRPRDTIREVHGLVEKLVKRGALERLERVTLKDGRPGVAFALPEARQAELAAVAGARAVKSLPAKPTRRRARKAKPGAKQGA